MSINLIKRKKGSVWRARYTLKVGRRITKCFSRKIDAEQWLAKTKIDDADPTKVWCEPIRFCELAEQFLKYTKPELQPATYQRYESVIRKYLVPQFDRALVSSISKKDILDFKMK